MLRFCVLKFEGSWEKYLPLVEFTYNKSFQSSIKMAPCKALYGRKCRTPLANLKRKEIEFQVGDKVFLKVSPWKKILRFGHKGKLSPRFIVPHENMASGISVSFADRVGKDSQCISFHVLILRHPSHVVSLTEVEIRPDMTYGE
ncbi:DNA/RNA polymerases superfamily protein [Gossypium australe]|uniref:DNA/RNA polymerases superfamily protein n=1 Tax=Gossypium australe TaxID=47621 RepID=A0A5B6WF67_9ROSI|nr:DNA/RNA polymerases superfamily protein [Gossypium australe]